MDRRETEASPVTRPRKVLLFIALLLVCFPFVLRAEITSFAIVSDSHIGSREVVYTAFIRAVEEQKIEVIIHTGDAIDRPGSSGEWARFFEITGPGKILHLAPGNHDIQGKRSLAEYSKLFPDLYYSFSDGDTLFILLNTELPGEESTISGDQFAWLEKELQRPFKYKFVFLHEPLFPVVTLHGLDRHGGARDRLHRLFVENGVSLVVSGHDHLYNRSTKEGITYVIAGGGGGRLWFFAENGNFFHYITASRSNGGYSFTVKDMDGKKRDQFSVGLNGKTKASQKNGSGRRAGIAITSPQKN
jgi:3',5'-cyclic AMP phosphodiesterase CpdA